MIRLVLILSLPLMCAAFCADDKTPEEQVADLKADGITALKESEKNQRKIVVAAKCFAQAAALCEKFKQDAIGTEMNSYLYWCKKKMTIADVDAFQKGGETVVAERLKALDTQKVDKTDVQLWFDRAETFAKANPDEHMLIAVRFFEVADRFIGTEVSVKAQRRSLDEMQLAAQAPAPPPHVPERPKPAETAAKMPVPDVAKLKDADKAIKDIFKDDFAKRTPEDKKALGQKLLQQGNDSKDDLAAQYVLFKEASTAAAQGGDVETALKAIDALAKAFEVDAGALKLDALTKAAAAITKPDEAKALARAYLAASDDAVAVDNYDAAVKMLTAADVVARKAQDVPLVTQLAGKVKDVRGLQADFAKVKTAQTTLKDKPDDPEANLAVGKFLCFNKGDWVKGLSLLAKGSDAKLKELAQAELNAGSEPEKVMVAGDGWWNFVEKQSGLLKVNIQRHAAELYRGVIAQLPSLQRARLLPRLSPAANSVGWVVLFSSDDPTIWNTKSSNSIPLTEAPEGVRFVRIVKMDTRDSVILTVKKNVLGKDSAEGRYGWNGTNGVLVGGHCLGIYDTENKGEMGKVEIKYTFAGWGFGGAWGGSTQAYGWSGKVVKKTSFEIAVKTNELTDEELKVLLK